MRKSLCMLLVFLAVLFVGTAQNRAEAGGDYYMGKYPEGNDAYLVSDSIGGSIMSHNGYFDGYEYLCKVKSVFPDTGEYYFVDYVIYCWSQGGRPHWKKDGTEYVGRSKAEYPVEHNMVSWFYQYSQSKHPNQWKSERVLNR